MSKNNKIHPVILSGGSGTRLWPLSRASLPKQLLPLVGEHSMLQATLLRALALPGCQRPLLVCNEEHRFLIGDQCQALGLQPAAIYLEPEGRNTAAAIAIAACHLAAVDPASLMLVLPADHVIQDQASFSLAVLHAIDAAIQGHLVTFGINPTGPETGFGYIKSGQPLVGIPGVQSVVQFVEKPDADTARRYLNQGGYYWNSGMFVLSASAYLQELQKYRPEIYKAAHAAWVARAQDLDFCRPGRDEFLACPSESIDYAVMQSTQVAAVVPCNMGWSDVGSWDSLWQVLPKDEQGNSLKGDTFVLHSKHNLVHASHRQVTLIGVNDCVVVETSDAVLVMHKSHSQQVKSAVEHFTRTGRREHIEHTKVHRPWGWYEGVDSGERFQVKRLMVKPGQKLSLQKHHHRAEHWVVVSGTALVTVGGKQLLLTENQSTYIPLGEVHRLENPGKLPLHIVEVQSGSYLGEDDIVRLEDTYKRQ